MFSQNFVRIAHSRVAPLVRASKVCDQAVELPATNFKNIAKFEELDDIAGDFTEVLHKERSKYTTKTPHTKLRFGGSPPNKFALKARGPSKL